MDPPRPRFTLQWAMVGVAIVAVSLAAARGNPGLGIFVAAVLSLTIARTLEAIRESQATGHGTTTWRRVWISGSSLGVALLIMGTSTFVFLLLSGMGGPGTSLESLIIAGPGAVLTAIGIRRSLWPGPDVAAR